MVIQDAYDKFNALVSATLGIYGAALASPVVFKELHDNIVIENNDEKFLKNGFCIQFASDTNGNTELSGNTYINQLAYVTITTANFGTIRDTDLRKTAEKKLLGAKDAILKAVAGDPQLNDTVARCIYEQSDPVELILGEDEKLFLMVRSTYTIGYYESNT
jgi:hypothetical protein